MMTLTPRKPTTQPPQREAILRVRGKRSNRIPRPKPSERWYVACVKSNQDRSLAEDLTPQSVTWFLPSKPALIRHAGGTRQGLRPLFPGYLFFHGPKDVIQQVLDTKRTYQIISTSAQDQLYKELKAINALLQIKKELPQQCSLEELVGVHKGEKVKIQRGRLAGLEATLLDLTQTNGKIDLILNVTCIGQCVKLTTDAGDIEQE